MDKETDLTFQDTIEWANMKSEVKNIRPRGIPFFYLIIGAVIILILIILIVYLIGRNPEEDALEMMKDDKYLYDDDIYDDYSNDPNYYSDDDYDQYHDEEQYDDPQ